MATRSEATVEDLYRVHEKAELVDGEIVIMSPTGGIPGYAAGEIFAGLRDYSKKTRRGHAVSDNVAFLVDLPHRKSFSPDASYYYGRLSMKFCDGPPAFAVEVRSENDYGPAAEARMARKRADYFAAGTQVVWDVDLLGDDPIRKHVPDQAEPTVFRRGEQADAEPALPGWRFSVDDLFPHDDVNEELQG